MASLDGEAEHLPEGRAEAEKVIQARGLLHIEAGAEAGGIVTVPRGVGRAQNDDGDVAEFSGTIAAFEYVTAGAFGEVEVDDHHVRARAGTIFDVFDELNRFFSIAEHDQLTNDAVLFEGRAHEAHVRGIVVHENDGDKLVASGRPRRFTGA